MQGGEQCGVVSVLSPRMLVLGVKERLVKKLVVVSVNAALSGCEKHLDDHEELVGFSLCPSK